MSTVTTTGPDLGSSGWFKYWLRRGHEDTMRELLVTCKAFNHKSEENARLRAALERCRDEFLECARIHRGKIDSSKAILSQEDKENLGKYDRSKAMAQICEEALRR